MMTVVTGRGAAVGAETWTPGGEAACALADRQASRSGARIEAFVLEQPRGGGQMLFAFADPAAPRERAQQELVDARIERRQLEPLLQIRERLVVGHALTRCSSRAAWQPRNRRRWAVSQPSKTGLRSMSSPSRRSPLNSAASARCRSGGSVSMPSPAARATSIASTRQSDRSS